MSVQNNNSSSSFYEELNKPPFRVYINNIFYTVSVDGECAHSCPDSYSPLKESEEIEDRFEILDIPPKKETSSHSFVLQNYSSYIKQLKREMDGEIVWKEPEPPVEYLSAESMVDMMKREMEKSIRDALIKVKESIEINDRWEILDL